MSQNTSGVTSDYQDKICSIIFSCHAGARLIILVNDKYDLLFSIKDDEHDVKQQHIHIQYPVVSPSPTDTMMLS